MKIAICFSGKMRTYKKCFPYIKSVLLDKLDYDAYFHTWQDEDIDYNFITDNYNTKSICIEKQIDWVENYPNKHNCSSGIHSNLGIISMYYKIYMCNKLKNEYAKANNIKYDCVIRIRPDGVLNNSLSINELNNLNDIWVGTKDANDRWVVDTFAFSSPENMNLYSDTYINLDELYAKENNLAPEIILRYNLDKYNIKYLHSNSQLGPVRNNGKIESHTHFGSIEDFIK